jgi:glycosyltransferase involved in cell wall biosynthesis
MKILLTTDTVGGVWTYALELARALQPHGVLVSLATLGFPLSPDQRAEAEAVPGLEIFESSYRLEWMDDPWDDVRRSGDWLLDLEESVRPDVVHLNGYAHGALPFRAPTLVAGHSCVTSWWTAVKGESLPLNWTRYRREVTRGLQAACLVVTPTGAMLQELQRYYGPLRATRVIPNGRDAALFTPAPKEPLLFAAGRLWDEAKNLEALERVAPRLPWPVYVAGEEHRPGGGEVHCRNVRGLGRLARPELAAWLGRAAIYALPARYEPFGLSALEAAFAGCALVLGDIPSLREVWGDAALYVPPDDTEALTARVRQLIERPDEREALAKRARVRAFEFTPERMAAGYLSAYQYLSGGAATGSVQEGVSCAS